LQAM